jgi:hypothetical protein
MKCEPFVSDDNRVTCVCAPLKSDDNVAGSREMIDDLGFSFVAPLPA